jgi:hypothetical protein
MKPPRSSYVRRMAVPHMPRMALSVLVMIAAGFVWMDVERASACSCARVDPRDWLAAGKPAVIGEVVSKRRVDDGSLPRYEYRLAVARQMNAELGAEIALASGAEEAACGFEWDVGQRVGALLQRSGAKWSTNLCLLVDPAELEKALLPFPEPLGHGPADLLAAGDFGAARLMALDRDGRIVAYGLGKGVTRQLSVCSGSRRVLELVEGGRGARLAVRAMRSMRVLRSVRIPRDSQSLRCLDRAGRSALVSTYEFRRGQAVTRVLRIRGRRVRATGSLPAEDVALGRRAAYAVGRERVLALDLASRRIRDLGRVRCGREIALSPGGRTLAVLDSDGIRVIDIATGAARSDRVGQWGPIMWLRRDRLLVRLGGGTIRIYDSRLRLLRIHGPYRAYAYAHLGRQVFGINGSLLVTLDLASGARRTVAELPDEDVYDLDPLPGGPRIDAPGGLPGADSRSRGCRY